MARVTVEDCTDKIPNRFELVGLAAHRAKDISSGAHITVEKDNDKNGVIALREIAEENLDIPTLREDLIASHQTKNKIDVIEKEENLYAEAQESIEDSSYSQDSQEIFVSDSHSDLEEDQLFSDNIIDEEK